MDDSITKYGIKFLLSGDIEAGKEKLHDANLLMFQTKLQNTNSLDIISGNRKFDDGTNMQVTSQHGLDTARIYVPPKSSIGGGDREVIEEIIEEEIISPVYLPAIYVYNGDDEHIGFVVCMDGNFSGGYVFVDKDNLFMSVVEKEDGEYVFNDGMAEGITKQQPVETTTSFWYPPVYDKHMFDETDYSDKSSQATATSYIHTIKNCSTTYDSHLRDFVINFGCCDGLCPATYQETTEELRMIARGNIGWNKSVNRLETPRISIWLASNNTYERAGKISIKEDLSMLTSYSLAWTSVGRTIYSGYDEMDWGNHLYYCPECGWSHCQWVSVIHEADYGIALENLMETLNSKLAENAVSDAAYIKENSY